MYIAQQSIALCMNKKMTKQEVLAKLDHTLLKQTATWEEIRALCEEAILYHTASVCIPPSYVKPVKAYVQNRIPICTVIGFPNGYTTTAQKEFEVRDAIARGADELDMVINLGWVKDNWFENVEDEIKALKLVCGERILKVIIETALLTEKEKITLCEVVARAGADFIKTSTGLTKGATEEDVKLLAKHTGGKVKIKASGGISSFEQAERFIECGAERLGSSHFIQLLKEEGK